MEILTGPRGGQYFINEQGRKVYIKKTQKPKTVAGRTRKPSVVSHKSSKTKSMAAVVNYVHGEVVRHCEYCGAPMTRSDVNDFGSLCERCYYKEYYGQDI